MKFGLGIFNELFFNLFHRLEFLKMVESESFPNEPKLIQVKR